MLFAPVIIYNFKNQKKKGCPFNLRHIHYQCLSQCKRNVKHDNQHSQHTENGPKIARNSEARWKLFKNIKTDDSSFKREKNRIDQ